MVPLGAFVDACHSARALCQQFDTDLISAGDAEALLTPTLQAANAQLALINRLGVRAADGGSWRRAGFQSEQAWFGHLVQEDASAAGRRLRTARTLINAGGDVLDAYVSGQLSPAQANHIADGLLAPTPPSPPDPSPPDPDPSGGETEEDRGRQERERKRKDDVRRRREAEAKRRREDELLKAAHERNLEKLKAEARRKAAADRERLHGARERRYFWKTECEGGIRGGFELPDDTAALLDALMEQHFQTVLEAHKAKAAAVGGTINWKHVRADTFASVLASAASNGQSEGKSSGSKSVITYNVNVVVDQDGSIEWPDVWIMNGGVALPHEVADSLASDPVLRFLFSVNGKLVGIGNDSPDIPRRVKKAAFTRSGGSCENPQCSNRKGKEYHHQLPRHRGGPGTDPENILFLCWYCHQLVTYDGILLIGPPSDLFWLLPGHEPPERYRQWMVDYENRATAPARQYKPRSDLPGEKHRRSAAEERLKTRVREARAKLDEDSV